MRPESAIRVDKGRTFDAVVALPVDRKESVGFFDVERFRVALAAGAERETVVAVDEPCIAGFAGEQHKLTDGDDAAIVTWRWM